MIIDEPKSMGGTDDGPSPIHAIGAGHEKFMSEAREASERVLIDGCSLSCGKQIYDGLNLLNTHFKTTDFGVEKSKTEITDEVVKRVHDEILKLLKKI